MAGKTFTWQSSAPAVVSVDPATGLVTGLGNGVATITASVEGKSGQAAVAVEQQVSAVTVSPDTGLIDAVGATRQFTAVARDANNNTVANVAFIWLSSNHAVATITSSGLASAVGPGTATITAAGRGIPGSASLAVTQTATKLAFTVQPASTVIDQAISPVVQVEVQDAGGARVAGARTGIRLALGNDPGNGGELLGSLVANAVDGIASFGGLTISNWGDGYTLVATASGLTAATSAAFDVTLGLAQLGEGANCAITRRTRRLFCWGRNTQGQLGDGTTSPHNVPREVAGGLSVALVSGGFNHTCGITSAGAAYCWGSNGSGRLGDGTTTPRTVPGPIWNGLAFTGISAGSAHTCGTASGDAYCWGYGPSGQLGYDSTANSFVPVPVSGGLVFGGVSAGGDHTCGVTTGGVAYCWGAGGYGQLGTGSTARDSIPRQVVVNLATVQAGTWHACGLAPAGAAYCWGLNMDGQLGSGTGNQLDSVPNAVAGGLTFATLSVGSYHTCGITTSGATYCWGFNAQGRLGDGSTTNRNTPVPVSGGLTFLSVEAGESHTCGITVGGRVYCWGANFYGDLGDGTFTESHVPVRVKGG
jgi:hypothetical protein